MVDGLTLRRKTIDVPGTWDVEPETKLRTPEILVTSLGGRDGIQRWRVLLVSTLGLEPSTLARIQSTKDLTPLVLVSPCYGSPTGF